MRIRYCQCGARIPCLECDRALATLRLAAPDLPFEFWNTERFQEAFADQHMGRVIRAYRTHPHFLAQFRGGLPQEIVGAWVQRTQAQVSRVETGKPIQRLDGLCLWAQALRIPPALLWFDLPKELVDGEAVKRRTFMVAGTLSMLGGVTDIYRSAGPERADGLVAQRVFSDIAGGDGQLLASAQTTHRTDLAIGGMVAGDGSAQRTLAGWMRHGHSPVLRVNAAGILAKVGDPALGDSAISAVVEDEPVRQLYLTAVASRVLQTPWDDALRVAGGQPVDGQSIDRLSAELQNDRDAGARWCAAVLLGGHSDSLVARSAVTRALHRESCRENLRAYAALLAGVSPI